MKNYGFTLAEVLITLGIIGVVAAITIPNLITTYKAKQLHSQFLKNYSILQQISRRLNNDDIAIEIPLNYHQFLIYLPGSTDCSTSYSTNCVDISKYPTGPNNDSFSGYLDDGQIMLADGTFWLFEQSGFITIDINGYNNPPNKVGNDVFMFQPIDGEFIPMGEIGTKFSGEIYCNLRQPGNYQSTAGCAAKAKNNPDYFKEAIRKIK